MAEQPQDAVHNQHVNEQQSVQERALNDRCDEDLQKRSCRFSVAYFQRIGKQLLNERDGPHSREHVNEQSNRKDDGDQDPRPIPQNRGPVDVWQRNDLMIVMRAFDQRVRQHKDQDAADHCGQLMRFGMQCTTPEKAWCRANRTDQRPATEGSQRPWLVFLDDERGPFERNRGGRGIGVHDVLSRKEEDPGLLEV